MEAFFVRSLGNLLVPQYFPQLLRRRRPLRLLQPTLVIQIKNRQRRRQFQFIRQLHIGIELDPNQGRGAETLQRDVPLRVMFECSTVAELPELIKGGNEISAGRVDRLSDLMAELKGF